MKKSHSTISPQSTDNRIRIGVYDREPSRVSPVSEGFRISTWTRCLLGSAVLLVLAGSTQAESITFSSSIPLQPTNWSNFVSIQQFDPSLGNLDSTSVTLSGTVTGLARFENRDNNPSTVTMHLQTRITLTRPDLSTLVNVLPLAQTSDEVEAFDGIIDFGGASGRTHSNLLSVAHVTMLENSTFRDGASIFIGTGILMLPVTAEGTSFGNGPGNLTVQFISNAAADVIVTYNYHLPEPTTAAMLSIGGLALVRRGRLVQGS